MLPYCNTFHEVECLINHENLLRLIGPTFHKELKPFLLTEEELIHNNFPRPDNSKGAPRGKAIIAVPDEKKNAVELYMSTPANHFTCDFCISCYFYLINYFLAIIFIYDHLF